MACYRLAGGYRLYYASYNGDGAGAVPTLVAGFYLGSTGEEDRPHLPGSKIRSAW